MKKAFTLIEMLVVVAILSLLLMMTVPVVSSVLKRGQATQCLANLRAMAQGVSVYTAEHQGAFPPALVQTASGSQAWDFFITGSGDSQQIEPGWIWREYGLNRILQCPSFKGADNWQGEAYTGYNYNSSFLGGMQIEVRGRLIRDIPSSNIMNVMSPASTALFGDGEYASGANKFMRSPYPGDLDADFASRDAGTQGFRHHNKTHVAFVDGHVESRAPLREGLSTGFLSEDNDLYDLD
ncbi:prepilin-type N-terminal cleavage/methylation domain-containing protein [Kiritimatiellota bacterium B12222]|nr:prepilin-type N-terminal cleavage/methylation domain-containing protein [Kiritimatiellota bacterium B12222]